MNDQGGTHGYEPPVPAVPRRNPSLTARERWTAAAIGVGCVVLAGLAGVPVAVSTGGGRAEVLWSGLVYGALLASAAVVVYVDRLYARQCPRCGDRYDRGVVACPRCGYDLVARPRYTCPEAHTVYLDPGRCECGWQLQRIAQAVVLDRQVAAVLRLGVWLLAGLLSIGILLRLTGVT